MMFQINAHVDALIVVVQHTVIDMEDMVNLFYENQLPVTKIKIQLIKMIIDVQIPPKMFVCQKSIRMLKTSVRKIV